MRNISFDNPYWLLLAIPLAAALIIPYLISVSKDNRTKGWIASLVIHAVIIISLALSAAGLVHTTVMTRTKVYVVADVSYSSNRNLDRIDAYIKQIEENLPSKSMMGVICFGKDAEILTSAGTDIKSVKNATVDDSGTDIAAALDFTANLFGEGEIKRIVLITDGFSTASEGSTAAAVERLSAKGIRLDAVYLDNNLREGESEIQISDVEYTKATYLNHESTLKMLLESSVVNDVILDLYRRADTETEYTKIDTTVLSVDAGMNIATFNLPTDESGVYDYRVEMSPTSDTSTYNNSYHFTQTVVGKRSVLLVSGDNRDINAVKSLYGDTADIDSYLVTHQDSKIPYTIEDLVKYDEYILSNVDIRNIANIGAFIDSVDLAVSQYGKSLITMGNLYMHNREEEIFTRFEELLPVSFGNANKDSKLYTIVLDISRSMNDTSQLIVAKDAALKLLSVLEDDDYVSLVTFAGEAKIEQTATRLGDVRESLYETIRAAEPTQGTLIGAALDMAYNHIEYFAEYYGFEEKQVVLISDGLTFAHEPEDAYVIAGKMQSSGIALSTVNVIREDDEGFLKSLASAGGGKYYFIKSQEMVGDLVFEQIAGDLNDAVVEVKTPVNIVTYRDDTMNGILTLPDVNGYVNSKQKLDATMVLSVNYQKNSTTAKEVPLYSYREHGNGRVATFTSSLSGTWLNGWTDNIKTKFFGNILTTNTPSEHVNYPFNILVDAKSEYSSIEIIPSSVTPKAKASIKITRPDGSVEEGEMIFNLNRYYFEAKTDDIGRYHIEITYTYGNHSFKSDTYFTKPYSSEYDAFLAYDIGNIYDFMRGVGQISEDGDINLENRKDEIDTYELNFRVPLLILSAVLFVCDVVVRKFKWKDIKGLFARKSKEVVNK